MLHTVGLIPADGRWGYVDLLRCSFRAHCSSARLSSRAADHYYLLLTRAARRRDYTPPARAQSTVM
jgi:hypothetical protein